MYLLFEVVFYLYFVLFGWKYLAKMGSLGEIAMVEEFNEETGIFEYVYYDNSMLILLYSVLTIFLCAHFFTCGIRISARITFCRKWKRWAKNCPILKIRLTP